MLDMHFASMMSAVHVLYMVHVMITILITVSITIIIITIRKSSSSFPILIIITQLAIILLDTIGICACIYTYHHISRLRDPFQHCDVHHHQLCWPELARLKERWEEQAVGLAGTAFPS